MRIAFVFPGQGSQSVGMLNTIENHCLVGDLMERADMALDFDLTGLIARGPAEELALTVNTQPAVLLTSYALFALWEHYRGPKPVCMAGHSLGEYTALTAAKAMDFGVALRCVRYRAQVMQSTVPVGVGGMAAILGLTDEDVAQVVEKARAFGVIEAVNFNAPGQVVVAGEIAAIDQVGEIAKEAGARRTMVLPVSAPFHSSLLKPVAEKLAAYLAKTPIEVPSVPVLSNVDASPEMTPEAIRHGLALQACSPVQWVKTIEAMKAMGVTDIVEIGPGKVLTTMLKRTDKTIRGHNVFDEASLQSTLDTMMALEKEEAEQ